MTTVTALPLTSGTWQLDPAHSAVEFNGINGDPWGGTRAGFSAVTAISRSAFGVDFEIPLGADAVVIGDKVRVELELQCVALAAD